MPKQNFLRLMSSKYGELPSSKKRVLLSFGALLFGLIGFGLGFMILSKPLVDSPKENNEIPSGPPVSPKRSVEGKIVPLGVSVYMQGTHRLVDREGKTLMLLNARDEKLKLAEGMWVQVEGVVSKTVEGDAEIMEVEKVRFR